MLGKVGVDRKDIQFYCRVRFRLAISPEENGKPNFGRRSNFEFELLDEVLIRISREINNRGLIVDAEDQMAVCTFLTKSEA